MVYKMNDKVKFLLILITLLAVAILVIFLVNEYLLPLRPPRFSAPRPKFQPHGDIELYYTIKAVISTINATLLVILLFAYIDIYRKTKSDFTIGLSIFSVTLLLYALSSNPLVHGIFGFQAFGLGPFAMLPDLFTCLALVILLYLTFKY